jgi:uncharacterized membrane protein YeaQ/YmgE (transglycosylase-associated protein family)
MVAQIDINYVAVLVAAVVSMLIGAVWYSPILFGKEWMRLIGMTEKKLKEAKKKGVVKSYLAGFVGALVMSFILAHFIDFVQVTAFLEGVSTGAWVWLGFIAPVLLGSVLWENKPIKLYLINAAYWLVSLSLMGGILAVWV